MDNTNPAVRKQTLISPALLEEVEHNPKVIKKISAKLLLVQIDATHQRMRDPNTPLGLRLQFIDHLAKLSDAYPKANLPAVAVPGAGFSVNIIMGPNEPRKIIPPTIEVLAEVIELESTSTPTPTTTLEATAE